jgi:hypothetical protein
MSAVRFYRRACIQKEKKQLIRDLKTMIFTKSFTKIYFDHINENIENTCDIFLFSVIYRITKFVGSISSGYCEYKHLYSFYLHYRKVSVVQLILLFYGTRKLFFFLVSSQYNLIITNMLIRSEFNAQILSLLYMSWVSK